MKFTNIILAVTATASLVVANPITKVETTSPNIANNNVKAGKDCRKFDNFVSKCLKVSFSPNPKSLLVKMLTQCD